MNLTKRNLPTQPACRRARQSLQGRTGWRMAIGDVKVHVVLVDQIQHAVAPHLSPKPTTRPALFQRLALVQTDRKQPLSMLPLLHSIRSCSHRYLRRCMAGIDPAPALYGRAQQQRRHRAQALLRLAFHRKSRGGSSGAPGCWLPAGQEAGGLREHGEAKEVPVDAAAVHGLLPTQRFSGARAAHHGKKRTPAADHRRPFADPASHAHPRIMP